MQDPNKGLRRQTLFTFFSAFATLTVNQKQKEVSTMKTNVVSVNFGAGREYPYLNDKFDLAVGDKVYVGGKLAGTPGTVTEVLTKFKVSLKYYKYVLQKIDYAVRGKFCITTTSPRRTTRFPLNSWRRG